MVPGMGGPNSIAKSRAVRQYINNYLSTPVQIFSRVSSEGVVNCVELCLLKHLYCFFMRLYMVRCGQLAGALKRSVSLPFPISARTGNGQ